MLPTEGIKFVVDRPIQFLIPRKNTSPRNASPRHIEPILKYAQLGAKFRTSITKARFIRPLEFTISVVGPPPQIVIAGPPRRHHGLTPTTLHLLPPPQSLP